MKRAYRFRLYPKAKQAELLEQTLTLCRRLYNAALEHRITAYRNGQSVTYLQQQNELPTIKRELPEYALVHSQVLQEALQRLDKAYKAFFRRVAEKRKGKNIKAGFPRFKSENRYDSITYPQSGFRLLPNGQGIAIVALLVTQFAVINYAANLGYILSSNHKLLLMLLCRFCTILR